MTPRIRLAVTLGDPRGIGPEVAAAALASDVDAEITVLGAREQLHDVPAQHVIPTGSWHPGESHGLGTAAQAGLIAGRAIEQAARLALDGGIDAIVTAPIEKHALHLAGFHFPGHTEWLAHLAGGCDVAMMLASERLRVVLVTTHVALRDVPLILTTDKVVRTGEVTRTGLRDWFGIPEPRLAVCALNPHAGEQGLFGDEEARVLAPAAERLGAAGPFPADTVFVRAMRGEFDAVLAPYHDVGMTAIKVASFGAAVNVTLGLPFVRTSPDHGTALDIAGQGRADPSSMRAAVHLAIDLARRSRSR
ncbi:MAG: 4-hydroxythreonine-4-phosphate dehydrogenase PdxA [Gemmatimonadales bacterium]